MVTWPPSLPQAFEIGVQDTRQSGFIRGGVDVGPPIQRARFTATSRFLSGTMLMTKTQRDTFETFYKTTISEGADEFEWEDPRDFSAQTFRFVEPPSFEGLVGGSSGTALWRLSMKVERLP